MQIKNRATDVENKWTDTKRERRNELRAWDWQYIYTTDTKYKIDNENLAFSGNSTQYFAVT